MGHITYGMRTCDVCAAAFEARSSTSKTCGAECAKERKRLWSASYYQENREKFAAYSRKWARENPERVRERSRRYEAANREKRNARPRDAVQRARAWQAWYTQNRDRQIAKAAKYAAEHRAERALNTSKRRATRSHRVTKADLARARQRARGLCAYCGGMDLQGMHWDHVVPLARGGTHSIGNLVLACAACNQQKHAKTVTEWRVWRKRMGMNDLQSLTVL